MEKILAIINIFVGLLAFSLQVSALVVFKDVDWDPDKAGDRAAIDSLMIICGILAVIVNGIIAMKAPSIASK
ncbi:hypothetical protein DAPPUDRAFT_268396 [Daphnia pulex]|uniref:Uncharacterized protein n=1 Tax=Daphnia pulex TaxID=6669 RepID=E9HXS4_DAPPU|nr:hypothetical protein DAPPUDRAFT_268396 [Daphnia pulex]|eukprot:EFX63457.1 hypothetical protein DAPPUDRAFT_268396 [Daphnia pulex]